jgi:hypothetical protein
MRRLIARPFVQQGLLVMLVLGLWQALLARNAAFGRHDLLPTYLAPHLWAEAGPAAVYGDDVFWATPADAPPAYVAMSRRYVGGQWYEVAFSYHPWYLVAVAPLALGLQLGAFEAVFYLLNAVAAAALGWITASVCGLAGRERVWAALLVALAVPVTSATAYGQNTVPILVAALLGTRSVRAGLPIPPLEGALLLLASLTKPWAVLLIGLPALAGRWRSSAALAGAHVLLAEVLPRLLLPSALTSGWDALRPKLEAAVFQIPNNASVRALLVRAVPAWWLPTIGHRPVPSPVWWTEKVVAVAVALAAAVLWARRRPHPADAVLGGLALILVPLGTLWEHYLVLALPGAAVLAATRTRGARALGAAAAVFLVVAPNQTLFARLADRADTPSWLHHPGLIALAFSPWPVVVAVGLGLLATARTAAPSPRPAGVDATPAPAC